MLSMQLVGNSCKTPEILLHIFGGTSSLLHQAEPAFEPAFATLSLVTYVAHQNNDFSLSENRKKSQLFPVQGFFTELAQLIIIGLDKAKQKGPLFKHFFYFSICCCFYM